jgi:Putative transposase
VRRPEHAPLRQYVLTVPFELRARLAYDRELLGAVGRTFIDTVLGFYARTLRAHSVRGGQSGAVTVVQRVSSDLRLNPHWHAIFLDGVFAPDDDGALRFHPLPSLSNGQVADLMQAVRIRIGFSLHAATVAGAEDEAGREALVKYVLRPPIAEQRVKLLGDGLVRIELRRPFRDGTTAVDLDPLSLLCRLASSVPPPKMHLTRYAGVLAPAHHCRAKVVPPPPAGVPFRAARPRSPV